MAKLLPDMAERYWQLMIDGDADAVLGMFEGEPRIDAVRPGRVTGEQAVRDLVAGTHEWLAGMRAHVSPVRTTRAEGRTVAEQELHLKIDGRSVHLPTAIVAERAGDSPRLGRLTIYHSSWPLTGHHEVRRPVLEMDPDLVAPDVVGTYLAGLAEGRLQTIVDVFEADGYVREPAGEPYVYRGEQGIRQIYTIMFSNFGGITLDLCTVTDDGEACAVEYNAMQWGRTGLPPQAGIAVYERGTDGTLLHAARIYDDVDPPVAEAAVGATPATGAEA